MTPTTTQRVAFLDGLRGLAIALVVMYHAFARWPKLMPFGGKFADVWLFANGWLGVQLFFLISGFVIFMTLERSKNFGSFAFGRWARLFPAMLICSLLIWITAPLVSERPGGQPTLSQLLPGLTFIDEDYFIYLGWRLEALEGGFWSLFVEVKLYLIAGWMYFRRGKMWAIGTLLAIYAAWLVTALLPVAMPSLVHTSAVAKAGVLLSLVSAQYFAWFAAGALFYEFYTSRTTHHLWAGIAVATTAALATKLGNAVATIGSLLLVAIFVAPLLNARIATALSSRTLVFLGFVSYPLYLMHEGLMVALTIKLGKAGAPVPDLLYPVLPIACVIGLAWFIAAVLEPWLRGIILAARANCRLHRRGVR